MVFPTIEFLLFYAGVLTLNLLVDGRPAVRKALLIAASYAFYGAWDMRFLLLMASVSTVAWMAGIAVVNPRWRRTVLWTAIPLLLGVLGVFKYADFFMVSLSQLLASVGLGRDMVWAGVILPVGISFYVFQAISYVVDAARDEISARRNPADVALYISFFPQLVAGPIVRARDFLPQIDAPTPPDAAARAEAVVLILCGLFKKLVVANYLGILLVDPVFAYPGEQNTLTAWAALLGYAVQIYCDFSGYCDIAIGVALLMGYRFRANFAQPYQSRSLREFWQRWHISLSSYIRDYLYIPLGGNRSNPVRQAAVLLGTMGLAGLWHGAAWPFVIWGLLHGTGLVVERWCRVRGWRLPVPLAVLATFSVVLALWLPFRAGDTATLIALLGTLVGQGNETGTLAVSTLLWSLIAIGLAMNLLPLSWRDRSVRAVAILPGAVQAVVLGAGVLLAFALAQDGTAPFIYFQF
jgi:alginate O-acetyltransferase complex protein AlgI